MPIKDRRTEFINAVKGRMKTSGKGHVEYRDAKGKTLSCTVLSPGSVSGLKLNVDTYPTTRIIDNVPAATGLKQTGVYFSR